MKVIFRFVKVRTLGDCMVISIPAEIRREAGIVKGDQLLMSYDKKDGFKLEKLEGVEKEDVQDSGAPGTTGEAG